MLLFKKYTRLNIAHITLCMMPALFLISCGFTPLYSTNQEYNQNVADKLASIEVKPIKTIMGQEYTTALEDILNPNHLQTQKEYIIESSLGKDVSPLAIERDRTVTRYKIAITVKYTLKEKDTGKQIDSGSVRGEADYDRVESDYATYVSENDITSRVIREIVRDTRIKVIAAFLR